MIVLPVFSYSRNSNQPNVVIIYTDDIGYGDIGVNGAEQIPTPNIDKLAAEGLQFTDGHSASSTCSPSRYALLTGEMGFRKNLGIQGVNAPATIHPSQFTLGKLFQQAGYRTGIVGKWHLGLGDGEIDWNEEIKPGPREAGFDYSFIIPSSNDRAPFVYLENQRVYNYDPNDPITVSDRRIPDSVPGTEYPDAMLHPESITVYEGDSYHGASVINGVGRIGYMKGGKKAVWNDNDIAFDLVEKAENFIVKNKENPFFLLLATNDIHAPRLPNPIFRGKTNLGYRGDNIVQLDWCVGKIMDLLKEMQIDQNTILIFTSDNGPVYVDGGYQDGSDIGNHNAAGIYRGGKYDIYEGGTRVPFIVRWPSAIKPGVSEALVSQVDFLASFAGFLGIKIPDNSAPDSRDYWSAFTGKDVEGANIILEQTNTREQGIAIRKGYMKYINFRDEVFEMYDLKTDPSEEFNIIDELPEIAEGLHEDLNKLMETGLAMFSEAQQLKMASVFGDHMVIQRDIHVPVWGTASPGQIVQVTMAGYTIPAPVAEDSTWMVRIPKLNAGGPHKMIVSSGHDTLVLNDVMVGEVWLASGQSNMDWSVGMGVGENTEKEIQEADYPEIRFYTVPHKTSVVPLDDTGPANWQLVNQETVKHFSAVSYFFARDLYHDKEVPVGIISSSWGATSIHAWMSREVLSLHPNYTKPVLNMDLDTANWEKTIRKSHENDRIRDSIAATLQEGLKAGVHTLNYNDSAWKKLHYPVQMEEAGLRGFWGVSWFRKSFQAPKGMKGKPAQIDLFLRGAEAAVYLNGVKIERFKNPEGVVSVSVPEKILQPGENLLAIRLYQQWGIGMIGESNNEAEISTLNRKYSVSLKDDWRSSGRIEPEIPGFQGYFNWYTVQYNARIAPIIPYGIRGVIWYQGEGNIYNAHEYQTLFPMMIQDWRTRWQQGYFPFLFVQLANHNAKQTTPVEDPVAELRETQRLTLRYPNTGMASAIDIGDPVDIHPSNKLDVGKRLYLAAKHVAYGDDLVFSGPMYESMEIEGSKIRIIFSSVGGGLILKDGSDLVGFTIAGKDRKFYWANAEIDGNTVVVYSDRVEKPEAVRYGWAANPIVNLYNKEGLPAVPFRTDNFKMITE